MTRRAIEVVEPAERASYAASPYEQLGFSPEDSGEPDFHLFKIAIATASFAKIQDEEWVRLFWRAG